MPNGQHAEPRPNVRDVRVVERAIRALIDDRVALRVEFGDERTMNVRNGLLLEALGPMMRRLGLIAIRDAALEAAAATPGAEDSTGS